MPLPTVADLLDRSRRVLARPAAREGVLWQNWARTTACRPAKAFHPESTTDLVKIVREAAAAGRRVRVAGSSHSWPDLVPTDDYLVFSERLNRVSLDLSNPDRPLIVAEAGATVRQVNDVLERCGFALPTNVVLESVRWGGLVGTGSHGSGWDQDTVCDLVQAIEIVTATGEVRRFSEDSDPPEVMNAARLNLGTFGITSRVWLKPIRSYRVRHVDTRAPMEPTIANIERLVRSHESVDLYWWPFVDQVWVKTIDRTERPITASPRRSLREGLRSRAEIMGYMKALDWLAKHPQHTPALQRAVMNFVPLGDEVVDLPEAIHYRRGLEDLKIVCTEFTFELEPDFSSFQRGWRAVVEKTRACAAAGRYPFSLAMNARFTRSSSALLSPASGNRRTCWLEIVSYRHTEGWQEFATDVCQEWLKIPGARPHWGKEFTYIPGIFEHLRRAYGGNIERFLRVREALGVDPNDMFMNPLLQRIFAAPTAKAQRVMTPGGRLDAVGV